MDFFAHAEAFAALVNLDFVSINGMLMVQPLPFIKQFHMFLVTLL